MDRAVENLPPNESARRERSFLDPVWAILT